MNIDIREATGPPVAEAEVEIVERKGKGHPDTICDCVMENVSQSLCRTYQQHFGAILHHNCDKALLVPGAVRRRFGDGNVLSPMRLIMGDRAAAGVGSQTLDVGEIAVESSRSWFRENLPRVDPDQHLRFQVELRPGSEQLSGLFRAQKQRVLGANDTSAAVGYAPLTETESIVLTSEKYLNSVEFKSRFPQTGEDVKVLGVRSSKHVHLTVAMPMLVDSVRSEAEYFHLKNEVVEDLRSHLQSGLSSVQEISVDYNTLDRKGQGIGGMYLSVLGTSAEDADSGQVGRGNRVNGLIALNRPSSSEAAAGKNPVSHVGKIYSVLSHVLAQLAPSP